MGVFVVTGSLSCDAHATSLNNIMEACHEDSGYNPDSFDCTPKSLTVDGNFVNVNTIHSPDVNDAAAALSYAVGECAGSVHPSFLPLCALAQNLFVHL